MHYVRRVADTNRRCLTDKAEVDRREYCHLSSTANCWFITLSVYLCPAKLTTRCDARRAVATVSKSIVRDYSVVSVRRL